MSDSSGDSTLPGRRARIARNAGVFVASLSRRLHLGGGSVIGGRAALLIEPDLLRELAVGRRVALVSGTNGKTTTTRLFAAALGGPGRVATSSAGANLPSGLVSALATSSAALPAVLEVDEGYLPKVARDVRPGAICLLNLSRDQLDRVSEVRMIAARWHKAVHELDGTVVVANADDPLVAWAAREATKVIWVAAGQLWRADAVGCPSCGGRIVFDEAGDGWWCTCGIRRPDPDARLEGEELIMGDGRRLALQLSLPGRCNRANAAMAVLGAEVFGVKPDEALGAMKSVSEVEGRFAIVRHNRASIRLLLAKNPAGWTELLDLMQESAGPVIIGINARIADGHDPSWLWDVPFERLEGRHVVATGERCLDLAVRLRHAGVEHLVEPDQVRAISSTKSDRFDYVGNYTAFQQLRRALSRTTRAENANAPGEPTGEATRAADRPHHAENSTESRTVGESREKQRGVRRTDGVSSLRVVVVHPDLLGTYGDGGNGRVLANRAAWRGMDAEFVLAPSDEALPASCDLYCIGGGEDGPQVQSARLLADGVLQRAVDSGAAVLAVCAGFQVAGESFPDADGKAQPGAGLLDVSTVKGTSSRAVGELLVEPIDLPIERLTGFENHGGISALGHGVRPLGRVISGVGNGTEEHADGAVQGRVVGTYMHGPVLARNPSLADYLIASVTGATLTPLDDAEEEALREERLAALKRRRRR